MELDDKTFKSITFFGRRFTARRIAMIRQTLAASPGLTRKELAKAIAAKMGWRNPDGRPKFMACLGALELLERQGVIELPAKRQSQRRAGPRKIHWEWALDGPAVRAPLGAIGPIRLEAADSFEDGNAWKASVDKHHYLGFRHPFGCQLRYFIVDGRGRRLGCLLFESITKRLPCRDRWIGWSAAQRNKTRHLVVSNSRFLIFPWVQVRNLASHALGLAARQLGDDWQRKYHCRPALMETFVDPARFGAHSYKAAGWVRIGQTAGAGAKTIKDVYVRELAGNCRAVLRKEPQRPAAHRARAQLREGAADPQLQEQWLRITEAAGRVARRYDALWLQRRRAINTQLIMLFVFRLVLNPAGSGYALVLSRLWQQCRELQVPLYQDRPVSAAAMCKAREKLDAGAFADLHRALLEHFDLDACRWLGHRVFAVDGTKMNLPKALQ